MDRTALAEVRASVLGEARSVDVDPVAAPTAATERERFRAWVDDPTPPTASASTLWLTLHHLDTFWRVRDRPNVVLVHYADLKADLAGQMRWLAEQLGIAVPEAEWPELVEAATLARMRERADLLAPNTSEQVWHDNRKFFNRGTSGQWREVLTDADLAHYRQRVAELVEPNLDAWVHCEPAPMP